MIKLVGADGSTYTHPTAFFDNTLQARCIPQVAADGVTRCLPGVSFSDSTLAYYLDAACTKPAVWLPCHYPAPVYYAQLSDLCGETAQTIFRSGAEVAKGAAYMRFLPAGTCQAVDAEDSGYVYGAGVVVAPSTFVAFH